MTWTLSRPGRVLLAALAAGSGVIHLVMVRSHASAWPPEGIAFGLVVVGGAKVRQPTTWTVPAYTNPLGVFAHANPALPCADGS